MKTHDDSSHRGDDTQEFDARLRQLHAQAIDRVSPRTLVALRARRAAAPVARPRLHAWPLAATCAIALVAGGLFLRNPTQRAAEEQPATVTANTDNEPGDVYAALDESPELYVWLASNDTDNLVTEQAP
jgi:hypothetical protein